MRRLITRVLSSRGTTCETAENGQDAVDIMRNALICVESEETASNLVKPYFDFIMMDFVMVSLVVIFLCLNTSLLLCLQPVMDGPSATRNIRDLGYQGPIVGVTGNMMQGDVEHFLRCGATVVLPKPLLLQDLEDFLRRYRMGHSMKSPQAEGGI